MRRILPDGGEKIYPMPSGWETLTGVEPVGRVRLIGEEEDTVVKIIKSKIIFLLLLFKTPLDIYYLAGFLYFDLDDF